jgi:DNA primase|tara:strand:- start:2117 stop:3874 length:1758 start_codon:yes stop_codon:yes gene_type:complete
MSGLIPQHFIDDLIARVDIVEVMGNRIQLKKAGKEFKSVCPFHDDSNPSLTISPAKGFYHCFSCGAHGTAVGFLMNYEHLSFVEAIESLASNLGIEIPYEKNQQPIKKNNNLFDLLEKIQAHYQLELKNDKSAINYLKNRGITGKIAKRFNIGYAPSGWRNILDSFGTSSTEIEKLITLGLVIPKDSNHYDRFRERVMFPIRDNRGRFIGFGGRILNQDQPKYLNSPETPLFHKGRELYGLYECQQALRKIERLVVVEGYMDVISLAQHGIDYAVASMGTATTDDHFNRLFRLTDYIYFCFDGDQAGLDAAWRALNNALKHIREGRQIKFVFLPENDDPDTFIKKNSASIFEKELNNGKDLSDFLIEKLAEDIDIKSIDGKARLAEKAKPLISIIPDGIFKELIVNKLSESVGLSAKKLASLISEHKKNNLKIATEQKQRIFNNKVQNNKKEKTSITKKAITLILNYPPIGRQADLNLIEKNIEPGTEILKKLIQTIQKKPDINTAGLIEVWRNDAEGKFLGQLASKELPGNDEFNAQAELNDCLTQLNKSYTKTRVTSLINKQRNEDLSNDEKKELNILINSRK